MFRRLFVVSVVSSLFVWSCSDDPSEPQVEPEVAPRAPSALSAFASSSAQIEIIWNDLSSDETGFLVERSSGDNVFAIIDSLAENSSEYIDASVVASQTYIYRVLAHRESVQSDPSNEVPVIAADNEAPLIPFDPAPANRHLDFAPAASIQLSWSGSDADGDVLKYDLFYGDSRQALVELASDMTETTFTVAESIVANHSYFWQVVVTDTKGVSRQSPVWNFSTTVDRISVPAGLFIMGNTYGDSTSQFFHPGNPVAVGNFNIDRFEVSHQQYATFLNQAISEELVIVRSGVAYDLTGRIPYAGLYEERVPGETSVGDEHSGIEYLSAEGIFVVRAGLENFPVVEVTWYGADAYAQFLGRRLPSESEWEKAARGISTEVASRSFVLQDSTFVIGEGFIFPWGTEPDLERGNFDDSGDPFENQGAVRTTPVGYYDGEVQNGYATGSGRSTFGVDDMAGNVWEWCADWFLKDYSAPHTPPREGNDKVVRGGSYESGISTAQTFNRTFLAPEIRDRVVGFRTASTGLLIPG